MANKSLVQQPNPVPIFALIGMVVLVAAALVVWFNSGDFVSGTIPNDRGQGAVVSTAFPTNEPTTTSTSEPTATAVPTKPAEYPSENQEWLLNVIFPKVREAGCEPTYEASYDAFDLYVNSIVWTVDESGNPVQGLVVLDLCSGEAVAEEGEVKTYLGFYILGDGYPDDENVESWRGAPETSFLVGPNYLISTMGYYPPLDYIVPPVPISLPERYLGFLDSSGLVGLRELYVCLNTRASDEYRPHFYTSFVVQVPAVVAETFGEYLGWAGPRSETDVDQCISK